MLKAIESKPLPESNLAQAEPNGNRKEIIYFPSTDLDGYDRERDEKFEEEHELYS